MTRIRGFEAIAKDKSRIVAMPQRATNGSAGYDIRADETVTIPSSRKQFMPVLVHTGIKAYFQKNEALNIYNRSSNPIKRGLFLCNGVGLIDSDYYDSGSSGGELMAEFINLGPNAYTIRRGDRIVQGVFTPVLFADDDTPRNQKRTGGLGSTGR